ncbi:MULTISPECIES: phage holin family protein [Maribacter]|uniref:phage holin family protein n=1 Tax=Maribacter TaxID=252356 RepID=UPI00047CBDBF|nr:MULTISPECIES: phage holin family protein [Maribacter]|tara:strand:+ start:547 stop:891 length:345 start_codon:yes stop_codon:yes gene_type:complete
MAFEELKNDLMGLKTEVGSYIEHSDEYYRLKIFKVLSKNVTGLLKFILIGVSSLFALLFVSFAACLWLSEVLNSYFSGFILVAGFYILIAILLYLFREQLNRPVLKKLSKYYFD